MGAPRQLDEASADRRVILISLTVMFALVLSGVTIAALFATTSCRQLDPTLTSERIAALTDGAARTMLTDAGVPTEALAPVERLLGPLRSAVALPLEQPLRIGPAPTGIAAVVVTGDGAVLVSSAGDITSTAAFRRAVTVVGDGVALFALVVGNTLTGQIDAINPLVPAMSGLESGTCVDTSAVGSPLSFLHDARDGNLVGLRTDEDGTDAVLELRDHVRGRVWSPVVELPRAPAGLQGSRTSGAIGVDTVVMVRRTVRDADEPMPAVIAFEKAGGTRRWQLMPDEVRALLPAELADAPTLRLEVAMVDAARATIVAFPDVAPDAPLPLPTYGPLGALRDPDPRSVTLVLDAGDGSPVDVIAGPAPFGRDGAERDGLLRSVAELGFDARDVLVTEGGVWLLVGDVLARFGG